MIAMNKVEVTREQDWKNTFDNVYFFVVALFEISSFFIANGIPVYNKVNRCLARYSPRATTTNRPINRALNKPGPN